MGQIARLSTSPQNAVEAGERLLADVTGEARAVKVVTMLLESYPPREREMDGLKTYFKQLTILVASYPFAAARDLPHPINGLVGQLRFLPTVAEAKKFMDRKVAEITTELKRARAQLPHPWEEEHRPTPEERERVAKMWRKTKPRLLAATAALTGKKRGGGASGEGYAEPHERAPDAPILDGGER